MSAEAGPHKARSENFSLFTQITQMVTTIVNCFPRM